MAVPCLRCLQHAHTHTQMGMLLTQLTQLVLSDTAGLSLAGVRDFPALRALDLSRCESVTAATLQPALESMTELAVLTLDCCHMLTSLRLNMPALQVCEWWRCALLGALCC